MVGMVEPHGAPLPEHFRPPTTDTFTRWHLPASSGPKDRAVWTASLAARLLGEQLLLQPQFWQQVHALRHEREPDYSAVARLYLRRGKPGPDDRLDLLTRYLRAAAFPDLGPLRSYLRDADARAWTDDRLDPLNLAECERVLGTLRLDRCGEHEVTNLPIRKAWWTDAPLEPHEPKYAARIDLAVTLERAAIRVARRGAGRCANPACVPPPCLDRDKRLRLYDVPREHRPGAGAILSNEQRADYCDPCTRSLGATTADDWDEDRRLFEQAAACLLGVRSRGERRRAGTS